jgi:hypothetical protein
MTAGIEIFINEKRKSFPEPSDAEWMLIDINTPSV